MAITIEAFQHLCAPKKKPKFSVILDNNTQITEACLRLRHDVFASELGANLQTRRQGLDWDEYDDHCQHIAVIDNNSNEVIATTRLLDSLVAERNNGFYSETEFDLTQIISQNHRFTEVGRTCIHPDYRRGVALSMLWRGISSYIVENNIDYLFGCASIPFSNGDKYLRSVMYYLRQHHFSHEDQRVFPRIPVHISDEGPNPDDVVVPTLLRAYLRQGAKICGEPFWDAAFSVADVFVLLDCNNIAQRYNDYFIRSA